MADADLIPILARDARRFSFFQVVQILERLRPDDARLGHEGPPEREFVRLRPSLSLAFPSSDLASVTALEEGDRTRVQVETNFLGLYGSTTPLPSFYAEEMLQDSAEDSLVRGVLDLFHHRLLSLLYRAWKKYRPYIQFRPDARDDFTWRLLCLMGLGIQDAADRSPVPAAWLLRYAGLLNQRPASAAALRAGISDFFSGLPVEVTSFTARWVAIPDADRCRLGVANSTLGEDLHAGEAVADRAGRFRVTLGPLDLDTYLSFLPGQPNLTLISGLARAFTPDLLAYELQLDLCTTGLPATRLAADGPVPPLLGETTWLGAPGEQVASVRVPGPDGIPPPPGPEVAPSAGNWRN